MNPIHEVLSTAAFAGRVKNSQGAAIRNPDDGPSGANPAAIGYPQEGRCGRQCQGGMRFLSLHPHSAKQ